MKIFLTGATGNIGSDILDLCLSHPQIKTIVTFTRRPLLDKISSNPKVDSVIIKDWKNWPEDVLAKHGDAVGMIWAVGSSDGNPDVDFEYPLAFQHALVKSRENHFGADAPGFTWVHLSGRFVVQDQDAHLYFLSARRKIKGKHDTAAIDLAGRHKPWWTLYIVKPGLILTKSLYATGILHAVLGQSTVWSSELAACMTYLALGGEEGDTIVLHDKIVWRGREQLKRLG